MTERPESLEKAWKLLVLVFFSAIFLRLTVPIFDADFWWHLASGRWMWEHKSLMREDPFTLPGFPPEPGIKTGFALTEYWFSQLLLYGTYSLAGFKGLVLMRASVFTAMFYALYRLIRREGAGIALSVALVYISFKVIAGEFGYIGIRPQMWTSLFSVVLLYILESMKLKHKWTYAALPALMLLWGNMHGGFILGDVIIALYLLPAAVFRTGSRPFYVSSAAALLLSGLNPNGFAAFLFVLTATFIDAEFVRYWETVVESQSIFTHASLGGILRSLPYFSGLCIGSLASFALNIKNARRLKVELILLYALVFYMGVNSIRYIVFFVPVAALLTAINLRGSAGRFSLPEGLVRPAGKALAVLALCLVILFSADLAAEGVKRTALKYDVPYSADYRGAVDFIRRNGIRGDIFNDYSQGGYLIWSLSPDVRVFIYGRVVSANRFKLFRGIIDQPLAPVYPPYDLTPLYIKKLSDFKIGLTVLPGCDPASGVTIPLSLALIEDDRWAIVYADATSLVFMLRTPETAPFIGSHALPKTVGYDNILAMASTAIQGSHGHVVPGAKLSLARAFYGKGQNEEALYWANEYLRQAPRDPSAHALLKAISGARQAR